MNNNEFSEMELFVSKYQDFYNYIDKLGYSVEKSYKKTTTVLDYYYSHYEKFNDIYGIEVYRNELLDFDIRFLLCRDEHKIVFITGEFGDATEPLSIDEAKKFVYSISKHIYDEIFDNLKFYENVYK